MICDYFGKCGSCTIYEPSYNEQVSNKQKRVSSLLKPFYDGDIDVFESPEAHYRSRAEFRIWHTGDRCDYAMGNITKDGTIIIESCPKVTDTISDIMKRLLPAINSSDMLARKLFGVEFLATSDDEVLVTLLYHKKLDNQWTETAQKLQIELGVHIIGRARKQKIVLSQDHITERLQVDGEELVYNYYEGGFTQPNPRVNEHMLTWATDQARKINQGDLLESYCGLGNFTMPLSRYFDKVLATEISKTSIRAAQENCLLNNVDNVEFVRMSSEEMVQAINQVRPFRRMRDIELGDYHFTAALVDPPRAGLDSDTISLISTIPHIIYISCNPETLARDLEVLSRTHRVEAAAVFDQFPYTHHVECGVFLGIM